MCFNSLLLLPGRSVSEVWKELVESQDEKRKSRVLQKCAGRSSSSSAAAVPEPWPVTCWRYNHKVNNPQGLLALVKHLTLTLAEHPPHCTRSRLAGLRIMPVNGGAAGESEQHKGRRKPKCGFMMDGICLWVGLEEGILGQPSQPGVWLCGPRRDILSLMWQTLAGNTSPALRWCWARVP